MSIRIAYLAGDITIHSQKFLNFLAKSDKYEAHLITFSKKEIPRIPNLVVHNIRLGRPVQSFLL